MSDKKRRFVSLNQTTKVPLGDSGDWVEFRESLSWGEELNLLAASRAGLDGTLEPTLNPITYQVERLGVWLKAWGGPGFTEEDGVTPVPCSRPHILALSREDAGAINAALDEHLAGKAAASTVTPSASE